MAASSYTINISELQRVSEVHLPKVADQVRERRQDLGRTLAHSHAAFDGELFQDVHDRFRGIIDRIQELQSRTITCVELGCDGLTHIVTHHTEQEEWLAEELRLYEEGLPDEVFE